MKRWCGAVVMAVALGVALPHAQAPAQNATPVVATPTSTVPDRLSDAEFWALRDALSEPAGEFRSENLVSNETMFQWPIPELTKTVTPGTVYMGVAPDQNFTYMAALQTWIGKFKKSTHAHPVHEPAVMGD